jgi:osmoprotectant transport system substrate-binding protein
MRTSLTHPLRRRVLLAGVAALTLALTACGGDDNAFSGSSGSSSSAAGGKLVVGGPTFTEAAIMQNMYKLLLEKAGFTVELKAVGERPIYTKSLESGDIDIVPDYLASTVDFLNGGKIVSSADATETLVKLNEIGKPLGVGGLQPSQALNSNAFYVTKKFAEANGNLTTLSQLAALNKPVKMGAAPDCPQNPYCLGQPGLTGTYGLKVDGAPKKYEWGSKAMANAVLQGTVDVGESGTTDATLAPQGLVVLQDDKQLQHADYLVPVINLKDASDPKIASALNALAPVLTTADLTALNEKVDAERQKPEDVAKAYLTSKGLL